MDAINNQLKRIFADPDMADLLLEKSLIVGVSGGADSLTLLHVLRGLRGDSAAATLHIAHLNHWVRGKEAADDEAFVRGIAEQLGIPCTIGQFDVPNYARHNHLSIENAARRARYAFFAQLAQEKDAAVAVAHNADDQVETVLMGILRGAGVSGLGGMQVVGQVDLPTLDSDLVTLASFDPSHEVVLFRPLLGVWRWEILDYCKEAGLEPRWDSTNWERTYRRNRVRHDLIPTLQMQYSLAIKDHLYNLADITHEEDSLIEGIVDEVWGRLALARHGLVSFETVEFQGLGVALQRRVARRAISYVAGTLQNVTFAHIEATRKVLAPGQNSPRLMHLPHNLQVSRRGERSEVSQRSSASTRMQVSEERPLVPSDWQAVFVPEGEIVLDRDWRLESAAVTPPVPKEDMRGAQNLSAVFDLEEIEGLGPVSWRTRRAGDYITPMGMTGRKSLQDCMVDAKIPREQRDHIPVLVQGESGQVLWIPGAGGRRSAQALLTDATTQALLVRWSFSTDSREQE
ncbi:MAG: tRNA lysidine(34) synthetase TilS [Chloroflexota bacterium]